MDTVGIDVRRNQMTRLGTHCCRTVYQLCPGVLNTCGYLDLSACSAVEQGYANSGCPVAREIKFCVVVPCTFGP
jgi:hypothetical protein